MRFGSSFLFFPFLSGGGRLFGEKESGWGTDRSAGHEAEACGLVWWRTGSVDAKGWYRRAVPAGLKQVGFRKK